MDQDTANDGGFQSGSDDVIIDGYGYTCKALDHDLPVMSQKSNYASGAPKGAVYQAGPEKISVKIDAIFGIPVPARLKPFQKAFHGRPAKWWVVTSRKITSSNEGATIRTYSAELEEWLNPLSIPA